MKQKFKKGDNVKLVDEVLKPYNKHGCEFSILEIEHGEKMIGYLYKGHKLISENNYSSKMHMTSVRIKENKLNILEVLDYNLYLCEVIVYENKVNKYIFHANSLILDESSFEFKVGKIVHTLNISNILLKKLEKKRNFQNTWYGRIISYIMLKIKTKTK
jgi:hypothetical protein